MIVVVFALYSWRPWIFRIRFYFPKSLYIWLKTEFVDIFRDFGTPSLWQIDQFFMSTDPWPPLLPSNSEHSLQAWILPSNYGQPFPGLESCLLLMDNLFQAWILPINYWQQIPGLDSHLLIIVNLFQAWTPTYYLLTTFSRPGLPPINVWQHSPGLDSHLLIIDNRFQACRSVQWICHL